MQLNDSSFIHYICFHCHLKLVMTREMNTCLSMTESLKSLHSQMHANTEEIIVHEMNE